jgi:hypothetical protein
MSEQPANYTARTAPTTTTNSILEVANACMQDSHEKQDSYKEAIRKFSVASGMSTTEEEFEEIYAHVEPHHQMLVEAEERLVSMTAEERIVYRDERIAELNIKFPGAYEGMSQEMKDIMFDMLSTRMLTASTASSEVSEAASS